MKKNYNKKVILAVLLVALLIAAIGGVTYAFFNYTRTGVANTFSVGRISFNTRQTETINLSNLFPIDVTGGIPNDNTKVGTFELEITGDTDYVGGIEYLVSAVNTHVTTSTGQIVPISLDVTVEGLGTQNTNYFTARESKDATIYKRLSGNGIMGDQQLLVGYIKPNTTSGTIEGINGKITIKAYLDASKIAITDTYDGNETDLMGTTNEWVNGRVTLTTEEWNAFQNSGISFQVKVEANEDIWVEETLYDIIERQTVMDNINSTYVNNATPGIDFSNISSDTNGKGVYTFSSTANDAYPVHYFRGAVTNNNVLFANKCWKMVRTTDTGGVKMIYNGENKGTEEVPNCDNTGTDTLITLNIDGTDTFSFSFSRSMLYTSPASVGYMYGTVYGAINGDYEAGSKFGNGFTWDGTNYTITNISDTLDENHHYTCGLSGATSCSSVRYYFSYFTVNGRNYHMYFTLTDGKSIETAIIEMQTNTTDSNAKDKIDTWYVSNISNNVMYSSKIEDTIFCNDRSISSLGGLNPNGGALDLSAQMNYSNYARAYQTHNPSLSCRKNDAFTLPNGKGNGVLTHPVGLITGDEFMMAGGKYRTANDAFYLKNDSSYFSMSPSYFVPFGSSSLVFMVDASGTFRETNVSSIIGLRPVLSIKNGIAIVDNDADGSVSNPYIVK